MFWASCRILSLAAIGVLRQSNVLLRNKKPGISCFMYKALFLASALNKILGFLKPRAVFYILVTQGGFAATLTRVCEYLWIFALLLHAGFL